MSTLIVAVLGLLALAALLPRRKNVEIDLDPQAFENAIQTQKDAQLIDVRTPGEHAGGRIAGAKLIPLQELQARLQELDKARPVLVYCASGGRSSAAVGLLKGSGFAKVAHLDCGISGWAGEGKPVQR